MRRPALAVLGLLAPAWLPVLAADARPALVFQNVRVFDGARVLPDRTVVVQDGKIVSIDRAGRVPEGAEVVDGRGKTLLPGLIDAHTHVFGSALRQALMFGVTTELDMFCAHFLAAMLRREQAAGPVTDRADLLSAGTLVTAPGGHGTEYGLAIPTLEGPDQAQAFVDARVAEGSDYIKIVYGHSSPSAKTLSRETLAAVVAAAHLRGKLAVVHIATVQDARDALECGADGLAHLTLDQPMDEALARLAVRNRAFVIPTLSVLESVTGVAGGAALAEEPEMAQALASGSVAYLAKPFPARPGSTLSYANATESVRRLRTAGVPILAGTDAPNPGTVHGASIHRELELLVQAGLRPLEALAAATSIPAARFRLSDRGVLAPGKRADMLLVRGDPTRDIRATRRIVGIWKHGVAVDRAAYAAEIDAPGH